MAEVTIYKSPLDDEILRTINVDKFTSLSKLLYSQKELHWKYATVYVNGKAIPVVDWNFFVILPTDTIKIVPQIGKGRTWAIVGMVIAVTIAMIIAPEIVFTWAFAAYVGQAALIGYAVGSIVDSFVYRPSSPKMQLPSASGDMMSDSPAYGWDGPMLVTQPDGPIGITYGEFLIGGALIMQYLSSDGTYSYLHMLINLGEGQIEGIMKSDETGVCSSTSDTPYILINGQTYNSFADISWDYRLGTRHQSVIDGFHNTSTSYSDGRKIVNGSPVTYTMTGNNIEEFVIQLTSPQLFQQDNAGNILEQSISYKIEYRIVGAPSWTDGGTHSFSGKSKTTVYEYKKISNLTAGNYEIKVTRVSPEYTSFKMAGDLYLNAVTETTYENIAYRNSALLALKIRATEQLQGSTPNVLTLTRGRPVEVPDLQITSVTQTYEDCYWHDDDGAYKRTVDHEVCTDTGNLTTQWTKNPIWNSRDFILNKRYGAGEYVSSDNFDTTTAAIEAKHAWELVDDLNGGTEHRFQLNIALAKFTAIPSALMTLARNFRGMFVWINDTYKIIIDRARTPVQIFNMSNIVPKSVKTTYLPASKIPNFLAIQYADPERDYALNTIEIVDEDEWTDIKPIRKETMNAEGCTNVSQVLRDGKYYLNSRKYITKLLEFDCDIDSLHCLPGDSVQFQHDSQGWGIGGRIISATSNSITTNIDIIYTADYVTRVILSDGSLETKTVTSVSNNDRTLNISGSFTSTPPTDSVFTYGATDVDSKPFKIVLIKRKEDNKCTLVLAEESSNKYTDTAGVYLPDPAYSYLPCPSDIPGVVIDLSLTEMANKPGFYISFNIPQEDMVFSYANVYLSMDNEHWWIYRSGVTTNSDIEVMGTLPGQIYYVKIVSYNRLNMANLTPAIANITIREVNFIPPDVNGLSLDGEDRLYPTVFTKRDAKFKWVRTSLVSGAGLLPAGEEVLGAGEYVEELYYKYWVEILVDDVIVRKEIITDNYYVYTYEKNIADNTTASNALTIKVWGFNTAANVRSDNPAILAVTNPVPATPSDLVAIAWWEAIKFKWTRNTEIDFSYYYYRTRVETDGWSAWAATTDNNVFRSLTSQEKTDHSSNAIIYFELIAYDTFGNVSTTNSINNTTSGLDIEAGDIEDFAVTASKIFTKIPIITGDTWLDNTPGAGSVAWNEHIIFYNGIEYTIVAGNTSNKYIYWDGSSSSYSNSAINPTLTDGQFIIATNISGAHDLAWNAIANQVIGSAYIQTAAIQTAHIENLAVSNAKILNLAASKIDTGYLSADRIDADTITATHISANAVTASKIDVDSLSAINADLGTMTAGNMTLNASGFIRTSGKDNYAATTDGLWFGYDVDTYKLNLGDVDKYLKWDGADLTIRGTLNASDITTGYLSANRIISLSITGDKIANTTITGGKIETNTITANKINVTNLAAIKADLGTITAGNITLNTSGFLRTSGKDNYADDTAGIFLGYDSAAYKLYIGDATNNIKWDGSTLYVTGKVISAGNRTDYAVGNQVEENSGPEVRFTTGGGTFLVCKEITLARGGTVRVKFSIKDATGAPHARIYRNGGAVGTDRNGTGSWVEHSEDIAGWSAGDNLQLYAYGDIFIRDFRVCVADAISAGTNFSLGA